MTKENAVVFENFMFSVSFFWQFFHITCRSTWLLYRSGEVKRTLTHAIAYLIFFFRLFHEKRDVCTYQLEWVLRTVKLTEQRSGERKSICRWAEVKKDSTRPQEISLSCTNFQDEKKKKTSLAQQGEKKKKGKSDENFSWNRSVWRQFVKKKKNPNFSLIHCNNSLWD